ncbi:MAG: transglutaminase-like domain-containing protein [Oscillospiraceae bacterium]|jgi:hypothetical protein|nr:transglutaminase-like domain-containing protein [Oscillospiraceae bacterium]
MEFKIIYEKYAFRVISAICLCAGLSLYFNSLLDTGLSGSVLFFATVLFTMFFAASELVRNEAVGVWKKLLFYVFISLFTAALITLALLLKVPVADSFNWLFTSRDSGARQALTYSLISQTILLFAVTGVAFNLLRFRYIGLAMGAGLSAFCIVMAIFERNAGFLPILLMFSFIFTILHERILSKKTALTYLLPFMIIAGLITALLPSKQEPFRWEFVRNIIKGVQNIALNIGEQISYSFNINSGSHEFGVSMTGYSGSGNIGGAVTPSYSPAVKITNYIGAGKHIYLTGSVMDNYTGRGWTRTNNFDENFMPEHKLDVLELILALHHGGVFAKDEEERGEIFSMREVGIEYFGSRTRTMFHISKMMRAVVPSALRSNVGGSSMFFERSAGAGTAYRMVYADFNYDSEVLINLLNSSVYRSHNIETHVLERLITANFPGAVFGEIPVDYARLLERRQEKIHNIYTQLPDSVPERVFALAREITAGCESNYAKMAAIEQFLSGNFTYTRTPPIAALENGGDFADVFLFEMKEGFCTYFATAAAVLGRTAGIPTRYVQGYSSPAGTTSSFRSWNISENTAHAWVEAYIDGAGWIPFEPSPTFSEARYGEWVNRNAVLPPFSSPATPPHVPSPDEPGIDTPTYEPESHDPDSELRNIYLIAAAAGAVVIVIAIFAVFIGIYTASWRTRKKYRMSSPSERLLTDYKAILLLLEMISKNLLQQGETALSFALRTGDDALIKVTGIFERVRYGGEVLSAEEAGAGADYKEALLNQAKKHLLKRNKLKYYLYLTKFRN